MPTHSSILAWRIPWTEEPSGLQAIGLQRVRYDWSNLAHTRSLFSAAKSENHSVVSDALQPHGLYSPWNSPGQNTVVGSLSLLQGIFPTQWLNPSLPHCRQILYQLSHKGSPRIMPAIWRVKEELSINWLLILVNKSVYGVRISFEMFKYFTCLVPS